MGYVSKEGSILEQNVIQYDNLYNANVDELRVRFEPKQDLHGYDKPWVGGAGKNICKPIDTWRNGWVIGTELYFQDETYLEKQSPAISVTPGQAYTFSYALTGTPSSKYWAMVIFIGSDEFTYIGKVETNKTDTKEDLTVTIPENASYVRCVVRTYGMIDYVQFESGDTATAYAPYENICPIEGWDGVTVTVSNGSGSNTEIPIEFSTTIYGGYVDLVKGELVKEWELLDLSEQTFSTSSNAAMLYYDGEYVYPDYEEIPEAVAEKYTGISADGLLKEYNFMMNRNVITFYYDGTNLPSGNIALKLATPIHSSLTPQQIQLLQNTNTIYSNTNSTLDMYYTEYHQETPNLMMLRQDILANQPHVEEVKNSLVSFDTDMTAKLKECKVYFSPVQEGSGDPSPDNVRPITGWDGVTVRKCGKNLAQKLYGYTSYGNDATHTIVVSGDPNKVVSSLIPVKPGVTYKMSCTRTPSNAGYFWYDTYPLDETRPVSIGGVYGIANSATAPDNAKYLFVVWTRQEDVESCGDVQIEIGSTATPYEPYQETEIPIEFPAVGKNQWNEQWELGTFNTYTGENNSSTTQIRCKNYIPVNPDTRYYFKVGSATGTNWMMFFDENKNVISDFDNPDSLSRSANVFAAKNKSFITPRNCCYIRFYITEAYGAEYKNDISLNYPSTATEYEPYSNTIYGGYVDLVKGEVVEEYEKINAKDFRWYNYVSNVVFYGKNNARSSSSIDISDKLVTNQGYNWPDKDNNSIISGNNTSMFIKHSGVSSETEFKNWLTEVDPIICYKLSTPIRYTIPPFILRTLRGVNNIWSDANGDVEVTYWTHK